MNEKPTNPKDIIGSGKLPLSLWPTTATAMGCIGLTEGAFKYGRQNWRASGVRASIYVDACKRHLDAWFEGEECAPDSGVPHLANALACLAIIVDAQAAGMLTDDRAFNGGGYRKLVEELTPHVDRLRQLHAEKSPRHYSIADGVADNDWIEWSGGECPVDGDVLVDVRIRSLDGTISESYDRVACVCRWFLAENAANIIAYRVVPK